MANDWIPCSDLTGGTDGALDAISGADLAPGARAIVMDGIHVYFYVCVATSDSEDEPYLIVPDTDPGGLGWELQYLYPRIPQFVMNSGDGEFTVTGEGSMAVGNPGDTAGSVEGESSCLISSPWSSIIGDWCLIIGGDTNTISGSASWDSSILGGVSNDIQNGFMCSICGGDSNTIVNGDSSVIAGGIGNEIQNGAEKTAIGGGSGNEISDWATYACIPGGKEAKAWIMGQESFANGCFSVAGDAQRSIILVHEHTDDATPTELVADHSDSSKRIYLVASHAYRFTIELIARQYDGTSGAVGDSAFWTITGGIKRDDSDNTDLIGTPQGTGTPNADDRDTDAAAWSVAVTADDTNESLKIEVTGEADKDIRWLAKVEFVEVG